MGLDVSAALRAFQPTAAPLLAKLDAAHVSRWLEALRGTQTLSAIAEPAQLSRFSVGRFLSARSQPRLGRAGYEKLQQLRREFFRGAARPHRWLS